MSIILPDEDPNPAGTFPGPAPSCSVCSCLCCNGMPVLKAYELVTNTLLGTLSNENWYTVAGRVEASPNQEPFEKWLRANPTYYLGDIGGFGGPGGMCINFGSGPIAVPAAYTQRARGPKAGDSIGVRVGCRAAGNGKGVRISVGGFGGLNTPYNTAPCVYSCGAVSYLQPDFQVYPGPFVVDTSAATTVFNACDFNSGWGSYSGVYRISDYGFYLATESICGSGVARKRPAFSVGTAGPLNDPVGTTFPGNALPCAICARPVIAAVPFGGFNGSTVGWYVPNIYITVGPDRGDGLPPSTSFDPKWSYAHQADGTNLIGSDITYSIDSLDVESWRLTPLNCDSGPMWKFVGGWPFTVTVTVNLPEVWWWFDATTLNKLDSPRTLTKTISGFFRGEYKGTSNLFGYWQNASTAYVANDTTQTCSGDGCTRRFVYSPRQYPLTTNTGANPDASAPVIGWTVSSIPVNYPSSSTFYFNSTLEVRLSLKTGIADISEGGCADVGGLGIGGSALVSGGLGWAEEVGVGGMGSGGKATVALNDEIVIEEEDDGDLEMLSVTRYAPSSLKEDGPPSSLKEDGPPSSLKEDGPPSSLKEDGCGCGPPKPVVNHYRENRKKKLDWQRQAKEYLDNKHNQN